MHHHLHTTKTQKKDRTLVILFGEFRGNDASWQNMVDNLIKPYNADLAICTGQKGDTLPPLNALTRIAKYDWTFKEPEQWYDYVEDFFQESEIKWWKDNFRYGLKGGGSTRGIIPIIFKHHIYHNYLHIIEEYDRIILTRTDMYFVRQYPILSNDHVWIPNGEDHGGIYERLTIFPSKYAKECMALLDFMNTESMNIVMKRMYKNNNRSISYMLNGYPVEIGHFNSEIYHKIFYEWNKIFYKVRRSPLLNFLIAVKGDTTKSGSIGNIEFKYDLLVRYRNEYVDAVRTKALFGESIDDHIE
tara:strand:+ start:1524 stop:2426 length:903 start_codon:yes stop_codon:yes gene_type:complete